MKYLKSIYESTPEEMIKSLINWELINDAKDLSLDYLDNGFTLNILVGFYKTAREILTKLFTLVFNHDELLTFFDDIGCEC